MNEKDLAEMLESVQEEILKIEMDQEGMVVDQGVMVESDQKEMVEDQREKGEKDQGEMIEKDQGETVENS